MGDENKIRDAADAIRGIVEAVPVYQDAVQPAAKEVGVALQTVAKSIHVVLAPIKGLVWGYEKIVAYMDATLSERLKYVPPEELVTPNPIVAVPIMQSLVYTAQEEDLREMFANLLATAMDKKTAKNAHPSFVEIIRQLSPDEAKLLRYLAMSEPISTNYHHRGFPCVSIAVHYYDDHKEPWDCSYGDLCEKAGCSYEDLLEVYIDNLRRLKIMETVYSPDFKESEIEEEIFLPIKERLKSSEISISMRYGAGVHADYRYEFVQFTPLGQMFAKACIELKTEKVRDT